MIKIFFNLGKIIVLIRALKKLVSEVVDSEKHLPTQESIIGVVDGVTTLLAAKVIDIPGVDEDEVVASIEELKQTILQKVK